MSKLAKLFLASVASVSSEDHVADNNEVSESPAPAIVEEIQETEVIEEVPTEVEDVEQDSGERTEEDEAELIDDTSENKARDIIEAAVAVRDTVSAEGRLNAILAGITDIRETVTVMNQAGGVSLEALPLLTIGLENYARYLNVESVLLDVSLESYSGDVTRQEASLENLNQLIASLENFRDNDLPKAMDESIRGAADGIRDVIAVDAPSYAVEMQVASFEDHREKARESADELLRAQATVMALRETAEEMNHNGGATMEGAVALSLALESVTKPLGLAEVELFPTLESLKSGERVQIDLEQFDIAFEGIASFFKAAKGSFANGWRRFKDFMKNSFVPLRTDLVNLQGELEKLMARAVATQKEPSGKIEARHLSKRLHRGGQIPPSIPSYLLEYVAFVEKVTTSYTTECFRALKVNSSLLRDFDAGSYTSFVQDYDRAAKRWVNPIDVFSRKDMDFQIPGGGRAFTYKDVVYRGDVEGGKRFAEINRISFNPSGSREGAKLTDGGFLPALKKSDILKVGKAFYDLTKKIDVDALVSSMATFDRAVQTVWNFHDEAMQTPIVSRRLSKEVDLLLDAYDNSSDALIDASRKLVAQAVKIIRAFIFYADKSLATVDDVPSKESDATDEVSMEAEVKDLKPGKSVKFSHGHGKIKKVMMAPFVHGGKHHHASKDEPRFIVKADKGGHESIHKASALKLR